MSRKLNWTPIRMGDVYCSSACGRNCTHSEFEKATAGGEALVTELGDNWEPRVWENMGWFYEAKHKTAPVSISKSRYGCKTPYTCYFNATIQRLGKGKTAQEAFDDAKQGMVDLVDSLTASLKELS